MERERALASLAAAAVIAAGCGSGRPETVGSPPGAWRANATGLVRQLRVDIAAAGVAGTTRSDAARSLADDSVLYALLVVYSDFGGCRAMVASTEAPPSVARPLGAACAHLERAAALFARAAQKADAAALVRAQREVRLATPQLVRAALAIREAAARSTASARSRGRRGRGRAPAR